ncbi:MAG: hypothetical protein V1494_00125 [Candidatus Diapherotrites archaeon]
MGALDGLKDFYFSLEDKYYSVLDRFPAVYKIVDPIDKVIPSFALFLIIIAIIIIALLFIFVLPALMPGTVTLTVNVQDSEGNSLPGASIEATLDANTMAFNTDQYGKAAIGDLPKGSSLSLLVRKEGFQDKTISIDITEAKDTQQETINLRAEAEDTFTKTIKVVDEFNRPITESLRLTFSCSNVFATPPSAAMLSPSDQGSKEITYPTNCGTLSVSITDSTGYEKIDGFEVKDALTVIKLSEANIVDGTITVSVKKADGTPLSGIRVELYRYNDLAANPNVGPVDVETSDAGQALFTHPPGAYIVKTYDPSGRYGDKESGKITLASDGTETVNFILSENVVGSIKIRVVRKGTSTVISDAKVTLRYAQDDSIVSSLNTTSDNNGTVEFFLSQDTEYRATVEAKDYQLKKLSGLKIGNAVVNAEMESCTPTTCGTLIVKVETQEGKKVEGATVYLYDDSTKSLTGYSSKSTDINGLARFSGIGLGTYYAFAYKESVSGQSDSKYFSAQTNDDDEIDLTVKIIVEDGTVAAKVVDKDGKPVPFATVEVHNSLNGTIENRGLTDGDGNFSYETPADKRVYLVVSKKDSVPRLATYTTAEKPVLPQTIQQFKVMLEPEIINKEVELKFIGLYSGANYVAGSEKTGIVGIVAAGQEYTAKLQLRIPEESDYIETGVHLRTGKATMLEKDQLFIKKVNAPNASVFKAAAYDEVSGLGQDEYKQTVSDAKWVNFSWQDLAPGVYEIEAVIKINSTASLGEELPIYYRAWAENSDGLRVFYPEDELIESSELYNNSKQAIYQVGMATICDEKFCFSSTISDIKAGLIESVSDSYSAKMLNEYKMDFAIINNSETDIHNNANLRIANSDESILFTDYKLFDAETNEISGVVNGYEFPRIEVGNLDKKKKISGTIYFVTQKPISGAINFKLVSALNPGEAGVIVFEKNIIVNTSAAKDLSVVVSPTSYPSGIENDLNALVKNSSTKLELEDATVRIKDRFGNTIVFDQTGKDGLAFLTLPAQVPGTELTLEVSKPEYNTKTVKLSIEAGILEFNPDSLGVSLNVKTKIEADSKLSISNKTFFPVTIDSVRLTGDFQNLLDETAIDNWLEASYNGTRIDAGKSKEIILKTYLSDDGKALEERKSLEGDLYFVASNFGEHWFFTVPVTISIGLGGEVDDPTCLQLTKAEWTASTEGKAIETEFMIQNNCTVGQQPVALKNLEAKVNQQGNQLGEYTLTIGSTTSTLRSGFFKKLLGNLDAGESVSAILSFTPFGGVQGTDESELLIQATNPVESKPEVLAAKPSLKATISVVSILECVSFDRTYLEMEKQGNAAFTITTKGCGAPVDFSLESPLKVSSKEFTLPGDGSQAIQVFSQDNYAGQYGIKVKATGASFKQEGLLKNIRALIKPAPTDCLELNRYEFDLLDLENDAFDGYDTAMLLNKCYDKRVEITVNMRDWGDALGDAILPAVLTLGLNIAGNMLTGKTWSGAEKGAAAAAAGKAAVAGGYSAPTPSNANNKAPTVNAGATSYSGKAGEAISILGTANDDTKITGINWTSSDCTIGTQSRGGVNSPNASDSTQITCNKAGNFTATLTAVDNDGSSVSANAQITVAAAGSGTTPAGEFTANAGGTNGTYQITHGGTIVLTGTATDNSGGKITKIEWTENSTDCSFTDTTDISNLNTKEATARISITCTGNFGTQYATLSVTNSKGETQRVTATINVVAGSSANTATETCNDYDKTPIKTCSKQKPLYCTSAKEITNNCLACGCDVGTCNEQTLLCELGELAAIPSHSPTALASLFDFGGGSGGVLGMATSMMSSFTGTANPILNAGAVLVGATLINYYGEDEAKPFTVIKPNLGINNSGIVLWAGETAEGGTVDGDVKVAVQGEPEYRGSPTDVALKWETRTLIFTNETQFTTMEDSPLYKILDVKGSQENYDKGTYSKDEIISGDRLNEGKVKKTKADAFEQKFHLEFNAVPPEGPSTEFPPLLNCQAGLRTGDTGANAKNFQEPDLPRIKLDWGFGAIDDDSCDASNNGFIYCDATQFSIEVLKKINLIDSVISNNGMALNNCPSQLQGTGENTSSITAFDTGITKIAAKKQGASDINVAVTVENTNPGAIETDVKISVKNQRTNAVTNCPIGTQKITVLSKNVVGCVFSGLEADTYQATAQIVPKIDCENCENKTASDSLTVGFSVGAEGLQECEPYSTTRLKDFFVANGIDPENGEAQEVLNAVSFDAYLIRDGYSSDFQNDFDDYAMTKAFFETPNYYNESQGLGVYFRNHDLLSFGPRSGTESDSGYTLPAPGAYNVEIDITYNNDNWNLFTSGSDSEPDATIRVKLNRADSPNPDNPFYYIPFDGLVGTDSGRNGYGVNFNGRSVYVNEEAGAALQTIEIPGSTPIPNGNVNVDISDDFKHLNNDDRGTVLTVSRTGTPSIVFSPSYATPVVLEISNQLDEAWGFYSVGVDGSAINTGPYLSTWQGIGINCKSFNDRAVVDEFKDSKDTHGISTSCALVPGEQAPTSYGFEFCDPKQSGNMFLKSIFYTPQKHDSLVDAVVGNDSMQLLGVGAANNQVPLNGLEGGATVISSIEKVLQMVEEGSLCVSGTDAKAEFWWNPKPLYEAKAIQAIENKALNECITD